MDVNFLTIKQIKEHLEAARLSWPENLEGKGVAQWKLMARSLQRQYAARSRSPARPSSPKRPQSRAPSPPLDYSASDEESSESPPPPPPPQRRGRSPTRRQSRSPGPARGHSEKRRFSQEEDADRSQLPWYAFLALVPAVGYVLVEFFSLSSRDMATFFQKLFSGEQYCDATHFLDCKPCPPFASCSGSSFTCSPGYSALDERCVSASELIELKEGHSLRILQLLRRQNGAYECGEAISAGLSREEIGRALSLPNADLSASFSRLISDFGVLDAGSHLIASDAELSFRCLARNFVTRNIFVIAPALLLLGVALNQLWLWRRDRQLRTLIPALHRRLQDLALDNRPIAVRNLQDELDLHGASWRRFAVLATRDSRIGATSVQLHGQQSEAWIWTAPQPSPTKL